MFRTPKRVLSLLLVAFFPAVCSMLASAGTGVVTIMPNRHDFGAEVVGLTTPLITITINNPGSTRVTVTGFQLSDPAFQLTQGIAPVNLDPGALTHYTLQFAPNAVHTYNGTFCVFVSNGQTLIATLTGSGVTTTAQASLSTTLLDFGTVTQGQTVTQTVTVSNGGTQPFTLESATTQPPFSLPTVSPTVIQPGGSLPLTISFSPGAVGTPSQLLALAYDILPGNGVDLTGTVTAASQLAATTFPNLPAATQSAPYMAYLTAAGGKPPYSWKLQNGSVLPAGLTVSTTGSISGTLASSVGTGTYTFTVIVRDVSVPKQTSTQQLTLSVGAPTGANCNNIAWNVAGTNSPIIGLDVLGTGTYLGAQGGLYPSGSNVRPASQTSYGIGLAKAIQPLDAQGNPDPNGKEVLVIIGESNVQIEGEGIVPDAMSEPMKNPAVVVVNAALGNGTAASLSDRTSGYWTTILNYAIPNYGVTPAQVVAVWAEPTDALNSGTFPSDISTLQSQIESEARNLLYFFPNIKLAYFSSRIYSGYSNGINTVNPEPYAFEDSFAVKWAIQDQLSGKKSLNYDPSKGPVQAPWMSWGPYTWANGLVVPSTAGYVWSCQDQKDDGNHPNHTTGREDVANQVLNFFKTDPTTTPWFLAP